MSPRAQSAVGFHQGRALVHHIAGTYKGLFEVMLELVQNAIDAGARVIRVNINERDQTAFVQDNGSGVTVADFESGLAAICETRKRRGEGYFGRFGIGSVSPLGKCTRFYFTSCPNSQRTPYREWEFDSAALSEQRDDLSIPHRERRDLVFAQNAPVHGGRKKGKHFVSWRTQVRLEGVTSDRTKGRVDLLRLRDAIEDSYGAAIRGRRIKIRLALTGEKGDFHEVETRPQAFRGRRLEPVEIKDEGGGTTTFSLYISPQTARGRGGKVLIGERNDPFRLSFGRFAFYHRSLGISTEASAALNSGLFEGEIVHDKIALASSRHNFEQDDALFNCCLAIEQWFQEHGRRHVEEVQQQRHDTRLQELGLRSLRTIEQLLKNPAFEMLRESIQSMRMGTIGNGHAPVPPNRVAGEQGVRSLATTGGHGTEREEREDDRDRKSPESERENHTPLAVLGPQGRSRTAVRANSLGLQIGYVQDSESKHLWSIDRTHGIMYFNTLHPAWMCCDEQGDEALVRLQNHCVLLALVFERIPREWDIVAEMLTDELPTPIATLIAVESPTTRRRKT